MVAVPVLKRIIFVMDLVWVWFLVFSSAVYQFLSDGDTESSISSDGHKD